MNSRKILGVVGALLLATIGTFALVSYVRGAEARATEGEERVPVYVINNQVQAGTPGDDIDRYVIEELVPAKVRPDDSVSSLDELEGLVADVDLVQGEPLLRSRFIRQEERGSVPVPAGLQELTISLEPHRAAGGQLLAGDTVGIFASFEPFDYEGAEPIEVDGVVIAPGGGTPNTTNLILHKILVTSVQLEELPQVAQAGDNEEVTLAPRRNLLVTLAVDTFEAERIVFAAEFGFLWLSNEPADAIEEPSVIQDRTTIYNDEAGG